MIAAGIADNKSRVLTKSAASILRIRFHNQMIAPDAEKPEADFG